MISCPSCGSKSLERNKPCDHCGFRPTMADGFVAWAPESARLFEGFPVEGFQKLARIESGNFWFRSRNALILWALRKYFPTFDSLMEVGCGTAFVLSGIAEAFPGRRLVGSEIYTTGLTFAASRLPEAELVQMDARSLPYEDEFDVVAAFDVIEHIKEDELVLHNFFRAVKPGGGCILTVPQHEWLWSKVDEAAHHQRRYVVQDLHGKVSRAGFRIISSTSFVSLLLPAMLLSRLASRTGEQARESCELNVGGVMNAFMEFVMGLERLLIRSGVRFPLGGSRLLVARKEI